MAISCECDIPNFLYTGNTNRLTISRNRPIEQAVLSPFVQLIVADKGATITVGNQSLGKNSPATAVIKSFQFGMSEGFTAKFEIWDSEGGNFCNFANRLSKDVYLNEGNVEKKVKFKWGWHGLSDRDNHNVVKSSDLHTGTIILLNTSTVEGGNFVFHITCADTSYYHQQETAIKEFKNMYLTDAIRQLFKDHVKPPIDKIIYQKRLQNGRLQSAVDKPNFPFFKPTSTRNSAFFGPKGNWSSKSRTPFSVLQDWLRIVLSDTGRGFMVFLPADSDGSTLIIRENDRVMDDRQHPLIPFDQRLYVVNGGKDSNVISFNTNLTWNFFPNFAAGGVQMVHDQKDIAQNTVNDFRTNKPINPADPNGNVKRAQQDVLNRIRKQSAQLGPPTLQDVDNPIAIKEYGPDAAKVMVEADRQQFLTETIYNAADAELSIVGDPSLDQFNTKGELVSILFINPFIPKTNANVTDWTIQTVAGDNSGCNSVLSSKFWRIMGVDHQINGGSYTTTLNIHLPAPGNELANSEAVGI